MPCSIRVGWWPRGTLQKYLQVICRTRSRLIGSEGSMPPSDGILLQNRSCWSRKCPMVPRECSLSLGHVLDVPRVILALRVLRQLSNPSGGPAFEPLISSGRGARVA
jgi:hypothetical protein